MIAGFIFTLLTGLIWTGVGIVYGKVTESKKDFFAFYAIYAVLFEIITLIYYRPGPVPLREFVLVAGIMLAAGLFSGAAFLLMARAMLAGPHGIAWTFSQSAMWIPFAAGLIFMGKAYAWYNLCAMAAILFALVVLGKQQDNGTGGFTNKKAFLFFSISSMFTMGIAQILTQIPTEAKFALSEAALQWRLVFFNIPLLLYFIPALKRKEYFGLATIKKSLLYVSIAFCGQVTFYLANDLLAPFGKNHLIYPIALSCCVIFFAIFCWFFRKEKLSPAGIVAMLILVAGIFALL